MEIDLVDNRDVNQGKHVLMINEVVNKCPFNEGSRTMSLHDDRRTWNVVLNFSKNSSGLKKEQIRQECKGDFLG